MNKEMQRLLARQAEINKERQALADLTTAENRDMTAAEARTLTALGAERVDIHAKLEEQRRIVEADRNAPVDHARTVNSWDVNHPATPRRLIAACGPMQSQMWGAQGIAETKDYESLGEVLHAVWSGAANGRLQATQQEASGTSGGLFVPEYYAAQILDKSLEGEIVRPRASIEPMEGPTKVIAGFDSLDNSNGPFTGFSLQWLSEGATATDKTAAIKAIRLQANKGAIFTRASNELLEDAQGFEQNLGGAMITSIGWWMDYYFLNGNGAGEPLGALQSPSLVVVPKETGQAANTILYQNLVNMLSRLHPGCFGNSVWVVSQSAMPQLLTLSLPIGTAGTMIPVMSQSDGTFTILTRPVVFTEKVPALSSQGDISLIDFSQYAVGMRKGIAVEKSQHVGWQQDQSGFRALIRVAGMGRWNKVFTPKNGPTQSWAVTLAAR